MARHDRAADITRYLRQGGTTFSDHYLMSTLLAHPDIARDARRAVRGAARSRARGPGARRGARRTDRTEIEAVASLDEDRILTLYLTVVRAVLRTNRWLGSDTLALKLDSSAIALLPQPRPWVEVFVYSQATEGVHLRGGPIARGGLRWSDRHEDFRTEILGLMKAQMVKNALIVPVGAKGGFVVKTGEVVDAYRTFVGALLDVTDNVVEGRIVPPEGVVRHDGDDPYLVVAADKGTATFSDVANEIAVRRGFWLGDAFASGGSAGYDHKRMGITARGAWESVRRHFRGLGIDVANEEITVVGIGDMSGDVFGNGMLLSSHIRLVAAFDHRHVFLDPDPDAAAGFAERERLFGLARSTWDDYDRSLISAGGGVFPRTTKAIPVSPEARRALGIDAESLPPNELIQAILRAPVDLLWSGGVGTYVKHSEETHAEAGDRSNDSVRVDGDELRCRVVGEGGNLGFTQLGRVEYALDGGAHLHGRDRQRGRRELLRPRGQHQDPPARRDRRRVARRRRPGRAPGRDARRRRRARHRGEPRAGPRAVARASRRHAPPRRARRGHPHPGGTRRSRPRPGGAARRRGAGEPARLRRRASPSPSWRSCWPTRRSTLRDELVAPPRRRIPGCRASWPAPSPSPLPERYGDAMRAHRLRREIIATRLTNRLVDRGGIGYALRLHDATARRWTTSPGRPPSRGGHAIDALWDDVEAAGGRGAPRTGSRTCSSRRSGWRRAQRGGCC